MKSKRLANCRRDIPEHSNARLKPEDVTWVKLRGFSWWPAQVVDENSVSRSCRPCKRVKTSVLLRLYGSYEYVYHVEPMKSLAEFKNILEQQNSSCRDMIQKTIDHAMLKSSLDESENSSKSGDVRKQRIPREPNKKVETAISTSEDSNNESKCRTKQDDAHMKHKRDLAFSDVPTLQKSPELSARRLKVMQSLGLVAPSGSPFFKNGPKPMV